MGRRDCSRILSVCILATPLQGAQPGSRAGVALAGGLEPTRQVRLSPISHPSVKPICETT